MLSISPYCHAADEFTISTAVKVPLSIIAFFLLVFVFRGKQKRRQIFSFSLLITIRLSRRHCKVTSRGFDAGFAISVTIKIRQLVGLWVHVEEGWVSSSINP